MTSRKPSRNWLTVTTSNTRHEVRSVLRGEYIGIVTVSALIVTLFFGGWQGPFLPPFIWFALKTAFFMMMFI